ncbi:hypothetical protein [Pseudogemmobacter sp. W21_MBD1_M6]|uniref:hypothetical protein n=1 Tax=Pseudogemmobacter sp. W21_MBD1_M6 TaxID=3240271 RepID=UPI003F974A89
MKQQFILLSFGFGALILATGHAFAQPLDRCADRAHVLSRLADAYGETRQSIGLASNNSVLETFASATTGTWTITVTSPDGTTCLVASGRAFETLAGNPAPSSAPNL